MVDGWIPTRAAAPVSGPKTQYDGVVTKRTVLPLLLVPPEAEVSASGAGEQPAWVNVLKGLHSPPGSCPPLPAMLPVSTFVGGGGRFSFVCELLCDAAAPPAGLEV